MKDKSTMHSDNVTENLSDLIKTHIHVTGMEQKRKHTAVIKLTAKLATGLILELPVISDYFVLKAATHTYTHTFTWILPLPGC